MYIIKTIGAIFCHVNNKRQFIHESPSITSGNQKWKGAAPILVNKAVLKIIIRGLLIFLIRIKFLEIKIIANNKMVDAKA